MKFEFCSTCFLMVALVHIVNNVKSLGFSYTTNTFAQGCAFRGIHISKAPLVAQCLKKFKMSHFLTDKKKHLQNWKTDLVIFVIYKVTFRSGEEHNLSWQIKESLGKCWKCNKRCCCRPSPFLALLADADGCRFLRIFFLRHSVANVPFILERRGHFFRILVYLDNNKHWTNSFFFD